MNQLVSSVAEIDAGDIIVGQPELGPRNGLVEAKVNCEWFVRAPEATACWLAQSAISTNSSESAVASRVVGTKDEAPGAPQP